MEHFRSVLPLPVYPFQLSYSDHFLGIGSCFVEQIGQRLQAHKFSAFQNPQGIVFNPFSVALSLERLIRPKTYLPEDLFPSEGLWHSFEHHSSFSAATIPDSLNHIHQAQTQGNAQLQQASVLLLTLGTANVWEHLALQRFVSNCHKLPGNTFQRRRLSVPEIVKTLGDSIQSVLELRPNLKIILTVSPVRYLREGLLENTRSKASLILAVEQLTQELEQVYYFPAYELLMDDLRDYRFYAEDLAHPNQQATTYIWDYFKRSFFGVEALQQMQEVEKIAQAIHHRPLHPAGESYQKFITQQLEHISRLEDRYPRLDFNSEKITFTQQLKA